MKRFVLGQVEELNVEDASTPQRTVETVGNHIYFYASVNADRTLDLLRQIRELDAQLRYESSCRFMGAQTTPFIPIWLHIQSGGGEMFASFSVADQIATVATPIYSIVEGYCASGATLISLACERRYILPNAFMLIHQLWSAVWGKYEEFKDNVKMMDMAMERMVSFYATKTSMNEDEVREMLRHDSWFNAQECVRLGLVDEVWTAKAR